eukprot:ANDGO_00206.mRNA.1 Aminopeptidase 2
MGFGLSNGLLRNVIATRYEIHLIPDVSTFTTFAGQVAIDFEVAEKCDSVVLNAFELIIDLAIVGGCGRCKSVEYDSGTQTVRFQLGRSFEPKQRFQLVVSYRGVLNDQMVGFYRSKTSLGTYCAVSQMEDIYFRRAVPSQDHPLFKATFAIRMTVPSGFTCLSNMPAKTSEALLDGGDDGDGGLVRHVFEDTPRMSTYLCAFIVGKFDAVQATTDSGVLIRVFVPVGQQRRGLFALDVAVKGLGYFESFFDSKYPLPKLDLIAVPDHPFEAMENWGALVFSESHLLCDDSTSVDVRQNIALVILHEISHCWFGNLVTFRDWNGLWLNEGFATWAEHVACDALFPEWNVFRKFVSCDGASALKLASLESAHPVDVPIQSESEINEIFDAISYQFGCWLIRMLYQALGATEMRDGIRKYLRTHAYSNAKTEDLWASLGSSCGLDLQTLMSTWSKKSGYPLLSVLEEREGLWQVRQSRFLLSGTVFPENDVLDRNPLWSIPISPGTFASDREFALKAPVTGKLNEGQYFPYRVLYTPSQWKRLIASLPSFPDPLDRFGLGDDACALSFAGFLAPDIFLDVFAALAREKEDDVAAWNLVGSVLGLLSSALHEYRPLFRMFVCKLLKPALFRTGYHFLAADSSSSSLIRELLLSWLSYVGDEDTVEWVRTSFAHRLIAPLHPSARCVVYSCHVRSFQGLDDVLSILESAATEEEREDCIRALGCATKPEGIRRILDCALDENVVRTQNLCPLLSAISRETADGETAAWEWIKTNWILILHRYADCGALIGRLLQGTLSHVCSQTLFADVSKFLVDNTPHSAARSVKQTLEFMEANIRWKRRDGEAIVSWLRRFGQDA